MVPTEEAQTDQEDQTDREEEEDLQDVPAGPSMKLENPMKIQRIAVESPPPQQREAQEEEVIVGEVVEIAVGHRVRWWKSWTSQS